MKRYTPEDFREIVNRQASDDDIDTMAWAADHHIRAAKARGDELGDADLESALELGRMNRASANATANPNEIRSTPLSDTAYSRQTEADWLDAFSSFVARVREKAFGTPDALFGVDSLAEMHEWIEEAALRERRDEIDPHSPVGKLEREIKDRMEQLFEFAPLRFHFGQRPGLYFTYLNSDNQLRPMQIDSVPHDLRDDRWFLSGSLPPIGLVAIAAHQMAEITGFESHDLLLYILTDIQPRLRRVVVRGMQVYNYLPDRDGNYSENGTEVTGTIVEISVRTPDLTFRELQKVNRKIRVMWEDLGHSPMGDQQHDPRLTAKDRQLMEILELVGGVPDRPPAKYWESVHELWVAAGYNAGSGKRNQPDSHRRLWRILERKLETPGVAPSVGAETRKTITED